VDLFTATASFPGHVIKSIFKRSGHDETKDLPTDKLSTVGTPENLSDPGTQRVSLILNEVTSLKHLLYDPRNSDSLEPDWLMLGTDTEGKSAGLYVKTCLQVSLRALDETKPMSSALISIMKPCMAVRIYHFTASVVH